MNALQLTLPSAFFVLLALGAPTWSASPPAAATVTLNGKMSLSEALDNLRKSGNTIVDLRASQGEEVTNPELKFDLNNAAFWPALDEVANQAKLRVVPFTAPETRKPAIGLLNRDEAAAPLQICYDGPFRMSLKQVTGVRAFDSPNLSVMTATLELAYEPRLQPLLLRLGSDSVRVAGPDGKLVRAEQGGSGDVKLVGEQPVEIVLRLPLPPRTQLNLKELQCDFIALVPPRMLVFEDVKLTEGERVEKEGVAAVFRLAKSARNPRESAVTVTLQYPAGSLPLESHQTWAMEHLEISLHNKNDATVLKPVGNPEISVDDGRAIRITYRFNAQVAAGAWTATYRVPSVPVRTPVRATFRDVPLP